MLVEFFLYFFDLLLLLDLENNQPVLELSVVAIILEHVLLELPIGEAHPQISSHN